MDVFALEQKAETTVKQQEALLLTIMLSTSLANTSLSNHSFSSPTLGP